MTFKINFHGVRKGSPFAIEVAQGALSADGRVPYWGEPTPGVSASIRVTRSNQKIAPEGIIFEVDLVGFDTPGPADPTAYNPQMHDIYYFWDFGDPGSSYDKLEKALAHQRNANLMNGVPAAHCFAKPGSYVVSVLVVEPSSGKSTTATLNLSGADAVQDPEVVFAGSRTIYVDPDGDFSKAPTGAYTRTSVADAIDRIYQRPGPSRVMLAAGKRFALGSYRFRSRDWKHIRICGQDPANPSVLEKPLGVGSVGTFWLAEFAADSTVDVILHDFTIKGNWNPQTETPVGDTIPGVYFGPTPPNYAWCHNVTFDGVDSAVSMDNPNFDLKGFGFSDCDMRNWLNFGGFLRTRGHIALIGNLTVRDPNGLAGGRKYSHNVHGPFRHQSSKSLVIAQNDLFNNAGWFPNVFGYTTQQPCLRLMQGGSYCGLANIWANSMEGGYPIIAVSHQNGDEKNTGQNCVIDGNVLVGSHMTYAMIGTAMGGLTVRNNLGIHPNVPVRLAGIYHPEAFIKGSPYAYGSGNATFTTQDIVDDNKARPVKVYSNTYANLTIYGNRPVSLLSGFTTMKAENNIYHEPNGGAGNTDFLPLDTTPIWQARTIGLRQMYEVREFNLTSNILTGGSFTIPYAPGRNAADYVSTDASESHEVMIGGSTIYEVTGGKFNVAFGASDIAITNISGTSWPAGTHKVALFAKANPAPNRTEFATPADTVSLFQPLDGSAALGAATTGSVAISDFYGNLRPSYRSVGAFELPMP